MVVGPGVLVLFLHHTFRSLLNIDDEAFGKNIEWISSVTNFYKKSSLLDVWKASGYVSDEIS